MMVGPLVAGDAGVRDTLAAMQYLVDAAQDDVLVIETARQLAVADGSGQQYRTALRIRAWLARVWRYVDDPLTREHLEAPAVLLQRMQTLAYIPGDCDEVATLAAALGKAVGLQPYFTVLAFADGTSTPPYAHVFCTLLTDDGRAVSVDITRPSGPVPTVARRLTVPA